VTPVLLVLFWVPALVVLWVYAGYPALAAVAARLRPFRLHPGDPPPALVTVGVAAYDEAVNLPGRIADVLGQTVPFEVEVVVASDGSTDDSAAVVGALADADPRIRFLDLPRQGQTGAQQAIFDAARGSIVVLTDAETRFAPGALAALIAPFSDRRVGCTTGVLRWTDERATGTVRGEGAYWRYEQWVRAMESRAGWLTAVTGALLAVRSEAYRPVPIEASMDHLIPLYVREQDRRVLAVADAIGMDRGVASFGAQFRNRSRTATRGIRANLSMVGRLLPWRRPSAFLAIWSHKLLRWGTPVLAILAAIAAALLVVDGQPLYALPIALGLLVLALAAVGYAVRGRGSAPRATAIPLAIVVVNLAFLNGWWNVLRGQRITAWHGTAWQPGTVADPVSDERTDR
jgi:cellulose synthase/poly-beta-1,6-N-acetylglucosamine synthase-like glycosyltransferase